MLRRVYSALLYVFAPLALTMTAARGLRDPAYRDRLAERLGYTRLRFGIAPLWIHAVSVGEVQAAVVLVHALRRRYPHRPLLITTATPTGAQRVRGLFGTSASHAYLPYDLPGAVERFLKRTRPAVAIVMEREIWPNLFRACREQSIPVLLASARVSEPSA
ncbi:MAG: 3-deoxy-D-manno-octulosonic acid transferase, partial [Steroidobacteraceae bacterium]